MEMKFYNGVNEHNKKLNLIRFFFRALDGYMFFQLAKIF